MSSFAVEDRELQLAVERLFNGRCAFCDSDDSLRPYRFRPAEEAGPSSVAPPKDADRAHLYYTWLVNSWQNIYAICPGCDPAEPSIFPVQGRRCYLPSENDILEYVRQPTGQWRGEIRERPLFLDPAGNEDYRRNLASLPDGQLRPLSNRGDVTIQHFKLNRPDLTERRRTALHRYFADLISGSTKRQPPGQLFDFSKLEFGGDWFLLLYQLAKKVGGGGGARPTLSRMRIGQYYSQRLNDPGFINQVEQAFEDLSNNPDQVRPAQPKRFVPQRGDMRPVRFTIENFKALEKVEISLAGSSMPANLKTDTPPLAPALVILGENAAGKSSILEAIALALSSQDARDDLSLDATRFMLNPAYMGLTADAPPRQGNVEVQYENGASSRLRVGPGFNSINELETAPIPVFAYGAFRLFLDAGKRQRASSSIRSLFEPNYVLPNPEVWLARLKGTPLFDEAARALKEILAVDQSVDIIEMNADGSCSLLMTDKSPTNPVTVRTPFSAVSSGFRSVLAMACDIMRGLIAAQDEMSASLARAKAVVLIDEVEAHLHPKWKMQIIQGLRRALPAVTFIMTTHDPLCLRGLSSDEVRVFRRVRRDAATGSGALPTFVEQLEELPMIGALTVEQLLTSDLFQLHTTDAPELENAFASAGDLLARYSSGEALTDSEAETLQQVRQDLRATIGKAMPIGSTEVERLIQEAVEEYLAQKRSVAARELPQLRETTRQRIIEALGQI